jgi:hypothetical protein
MVVQIIRIHVLHNTGIPLSLSLFTLPLLLKGALNDAINNVRKTQSIMSVRTLSLLQLALQNRESSQTERCANLRTVT